MEGQESMFGDQGWMVMESQDQTEVPRFHTNPRVATVKGLEDTPTCDSDDTLEVFFRDKTGITVARNFQGSASGVWEDEGSQRSVLLSTPFAPTTPQDTDVCEWRSLTQGVEFIDHLLPVNGPFSVERKGSCERPHRLQPAPPSAHTSGPGVGTSGTQSGQNCGRCKWTKGLGLEVASGLMQREGQSRG